jgi:acyl dehydratase
MPPRKLYLESVRVGDELPATAKSPIDRVQLAKFAGATGDFSPALVDEVHAKSLGMPSVMAPGGLGSGFLLQLVTDWARGAHIKRVSMKYVRSLWPLDTLVCKGRVADRYSEAGQYFLDLDVFAENQKGELAIRGHVTIKVFFSMEDENRMRAGLPPLLVNIPRESKNPSVAAPKKPEPDEPHESKNSSKSSLPKVKQKPSKGK